jgi:PIN domain nuclease of toxin-antitoxin system
LSLASIWELAIKVAAGKMEILRVAHWLRQEPEAVRHQLQNANIDLIDVELEHVLRAAALPRYHGDPFDRMVIAQAMLNDLTIITSDSIFARYGIAVLPA